MAAKWKGIWVSALMTLLSACSHPAVLDSPPAWLADCADTSDTRVADALGGASLPSAPLELAVDLFRRLPQQERQAISAASAVAASELGHLPRAQDLSALRAISRRAFYQAFSEHGYCSLPEEQRFLGADFFANALVVYLSNQGIISDNTFPVGGEPTVGREAEGEIMSWLIIAAAQAPPNNSFKPKPLRGSA